MKIEKYPIDKFYPNDNDVKCVVVHVDLGTETGTKNHLKNVASASYHDYVPKRENAVIQFVDTKHGAWHAGKQYKPNTVGFEALKGASANRNSYGICLEARPVDKNGNVTFDWNKAVDGEMPSDDQIARATEMIKKRGYADLPIIAHVDITSYKPKVVLKIVEKIKKNLETPHTDCVPNEFGALLKALLAKINAK